ncbi:DUF2975 domain-containing protein [Francisella sp. LA112445]|uniref:DUF2975 domain-containing protein n=1 Tax=Francisella sp. LA112445 TaxID=1395624 RepID=UPI001788D5DC|nr:DUF2975 domain-containing protein [Francisella sp. LA112445]QIW10227.1 DUF2975 domain-containing protein [Francisella sp. LA112445]
MEKIQKISRLFKWILFIILIFQIVAEIWYSLYGEYKFSFNNTTIYMTTEYFSEKIVFISKFLLFLIDLIPFAFVLYIILILINLFNQYTKLEIFSSKTISLYKKLGWSIICWVITCLILTPIEAIIYTYNTSDRQIYFGINTDDIYHLVIGGGVIIIAYIMQKAKEISEENELTI